MATGEDFKPIGSLDFYNVLWRSVALTSVSRELKELEALTDKILENKLRYLFVQKETGVPWALTASLHLRERSGSFEGCLHNGDPLGVVTRHVPQGRGPFFTWEAAAYDALELVGLCQISKWSIAQCLKSAEAFNGLGYLKHHPEVGGSPYVWSWTTHYSGHGKYNCDGHFDPLLKDLQPGVAAILITLIKRGALNELDLYA